MTTEWQRRKHNDAYKGRVVTRGKEEINEEDSKLGSEQGDNRVKKMNHKHLNDVNSLLTKSSNQLQGYHFNNQESSLHIMNASDTSVSYVAWDQICNALMLLGSEK